MFAPCPCGKPWELEKWHAQVRAVVELTIAEAGEFVPVTIDGRTWRVSRRCIAFHGITGPQLLTGRSGFTEIKG